jgi:hypothetical protein
MPPPPVTAMAGLIPFGGKIASVAVKPFTADAQLQNVSEKIETLEQQLANRNTGRKPGCTGKSIKQSEGNSKIIN